MNLHKIEYIFHEDETSDVDHFVTENCSWDYKNDTMIEIGLTINHKNCIEYIDGECYLNLDKLNFEKTEILKNSKFKPFKYDKNQDYKLLIFIALDDYNVIPYFETEEIKSEYEKYNKDHYTKLSINEWIIKGLLE